MSRILLLTAVGALVWGQGLARADCGCQQDACSESACSPGPANGCGCPLCALQKLGQCYGARRAAIGAFNCQCRGSYKFPAPPQYTYHWPGMYSQQTMTEYASPFRFPPLKLPEEVFGTGAEGETQGGAPGDLDSGLRNAPEGTVWRPLSRRGSAEPGRLPEGALANPVAGAEPRPSQVIKGRLGIK